MIKPHKRVALIFDFDDTLVPDSTSSFLESIGIDTKDFWRRHQMLLDDGHDPIPAYLQMMVRYSRAQKRGKRITRQQLQHFGARLTTQPGVKQFFSRTRRFVCTIDDEAEVFFFIVSSGIGDIIRYFSAAEEFTHIWSSEFSFNRNHEIDGIKRVVSFTDKTRYLFQVQKGIFGPRSEGQPFAVNRRVVPSEFFLPLSSMIMVGDGFTDVPCFSLLEKNRGKGIGVYEREHSDRWGRAWGLLDERRVQHMVAADFRIGRGLDDAVRLALQEILKRRE